MEKITYEEFMLILKHYKKLDKDNLNILIDTLYSVYDKKTIDKYFERYYYSLYETQASKIKNIFKDYFNGIDYEPITLFNHRDSDYKIMTLEEEKEQAINLKLSRQRLKIIDNIDDDSRLYPNLNISLLLKSIKDNNDLDLLKYITKFPYLFNDNSILNSDIKVIKKYINLCNNHILTYEELCSNFNEYNFDNITALSSEELKEQIDLLKIYISSKQNLFNRNLKLIIRFAKRTKDNNYPLQDMIQDGCIGIIKAINKYEVDTGNKFNTYASWWIRQAVYTSSLENEAVIRIPYAMEIIIKQYKEYILNNDKVSDTKCAKDLKISLDTLKTIKEAIKLQVISIDEVDEDKEDYTFSIDKNIIEEDLSKYLLELVRNLPNKDKQIILHSYGLNNNQVYTYEKMRDYLNISNTRIWQLKKRSLKKLRSKIIIDNSLND